MAKTLTILLKSGTMMNMDSVVAVKLARAALSKGYKVKIFCYGESVTAIKDGQEPKRFPNTGKYIQELAKEGVEVAVCETCCSARGIRRGEEIDCGKIGSLTNDLTEFIGESDRMITLGR